MNTQKCLAKCCRHSLAGLGHGIHDLQQDGLDLEQAALHSCRVQVTPSPVRKHCPHKSATCMRDTWTHELMRWGPTQPSECI